MDEDRAALDEQYNLRAAVPEHAAYFERYRRKSAALREARPCALDLPYGAGGRAFVDLLPAPRPGAPLLVFLHGGYWQAMDRKDFTFVAAPFVEAGWAAALVGYDLAPLATVGQIVADIRRALAWLHPRAAAFGADVGRLVLAGHSAGAHLAAMALATDWQALGLPRSPVRAACLISGVFDLEPIRRCYLNEVLGLGPQDVRRLSPIHHLPQARLPVLLTLGGEETAAFHAQSRAFHEALARAGVAAELVVQPGLDHFSVIEALADPANPATTWMLARA
jgi:arylformamidase